MDETFFKICFAQIVGATSGSCVAVFVMAMVCDIVKATRVEAFDKIFVRPCQIIPSYQYVCNFIVVFQYSLTRRENMTGLDEYFVQNFYSGTICYFSGFSVLIFAYIDFSSKASISQCI